MRPPATATGALNASAATFAQGLAPEVKQTIRGLETQLVDLGQQMGAARARLEAVQAELTALRGERTRFEEFHPNLPTPTLNKLHEDEAKFGQARSESYTLNDRYQKTEAQLKATIRDAMASDPQLSAMNQTVADLGSLQKTSTAYAQLVGSALSTARRTANLTDDAIAFRSQGLDPEVLTTADQTAMSAVNRVNTDIRDLVNFKMEHADQVPVNLKPPAWIYTTTPLATRPELSRVSRELEELNLQTTKLADSVTADSNAAQANLASFMGTVRTTLKELP